MPFQPIPINAPVYSNINDISLTDRTPDRINTYRNIAGNTVRRPGLKLFFDMDLNTIINGAYGWGGILIIISGNDVYKYTASGLTLIGSDLFLSDKPVIFAEFGTALYASNGSRIVKITGNDAFLLPDQNAPQNVSFIAAFDQYLLALDDRTGLIFYSKVGEPDIWQGDFFSAEQSPDKTVAIFSEWNKLWIFGQNTVEQFYNDGVTPFSPLNGSTLSIGCLAPYSIKSIRDNFYWLNDKNEIVRSQGNSYQIISDPIGNFLTEPYKKTNIIGEFLSIDEKQFYIITNPDYKKTGLTLVYDVVLEEWQGKWGSHISANYEQFRGQFFTEYLSEHLIFDRSGSRIYIFRKNNYEDFGNLLISTWLTGWIDHGTYARKRSSCLRIKCLRGLTEQPRFDKQPPKDKAPRLMIRWRDNGSRTFSNINYLDLGDIGDYEFELKLYKLGSYRMRQYEFSITDPVPFILIGIEELVTGVGE